MKQNNPFFVGALSLSLVFAGSAVGGDGHGAAAAPESLAEKSAPVLAGTVLECTNASRYTYVQIDTGTKKIWAAGPKVAVKVGDRVSLAGGMPNQNFFSATLKKTFDEIYFVEAITPANSPAALADGVPAMPPGHAAMMAGKAGKTNMVVEPIQKPEGGKSVAEVWAGKADLAGKPVVVRGKVVKAIPDIMGKTFLHLRDGSGAEGMNDLSVTTTNRGVRSGMIITVRGLVVTDKDFGSGYKYDLILEDADVIAK